MIVRVQYGVEGRSKRLAAADGTGKVHTSYVPSF